ncbi:MAG: GGDEF domain-containing protein [Candidatus Omnitrophica bacterium]|nr:GGDEF domain-containing protein [Candidatus Omnitrophota bacterium]
MRFFKGLLWLLLVVAIVAAAISLTSNYEFADRLTALFWAFQLRLLMPFSFEQFLVVLCAISLITLLLVVTGCAAILALMSARLSRFHQRGLNQIAAAQSEADHVKEQHQLQYEQLLSLGQALTKQLDKRMVVQAIIETASRVTSGGQANSIVSFWLLHPETDTFQFELGLYCDEALFTKTGFQSTEQPFAHVISTQKPWVLPTWDADTPFIKRERLSQLGPATGLIVVPCVIEGRVSAALVLLCHPEVFKGYAAREAFYNAVWTELALAAIIAIQGAVTILDRLTGTHTREYFMTRLIQEIERSNRYQLPISLLMLDIDNFKLVNDILGHQQGDAALKIVAKLIKKEVRAIDLVGRYGGEEFVVMLPETGFGEETTSVAGALVVAERIRKSMDDEFHGLQKPLNLTVSVGVAIRRYPEDQAMGYQEFIRLADEQLYRAKTTGKNKVCAMLPEKPGAVL